MRILSPAAAALTIAVTLSACADAGAAGGWTGSVDTLANGTILVSNPARGVWSGDEGWTIVEELRIGSAEVEGPDLFGEIAGLAVDDLGRIYVGERQAHEVRVFDANGVHIRTFGRKGGGPGEFESISGLGWGPDGNLWVMDPTNSRLAVFDTAGTYVTSHRRPGGFVMIPWRGGFDREGRVYDVSGVRDGDRFATVVVRFDRAMTPIDTFRVPPFDAPTFDFSDDNGRRRMSANVPFSPTQSWTVGPEGDVWIGSSDRYRIHRVTFAGDTVRAVERAYTPVAVTGAEKDEAIERYEWFTRQGGEIDRGRIPDVKGAFGNFLFDDSGYLWVGASRAADAAAGFDVFDAEGRYLGPVDTPYDIGSGLRSPLIVGDRIYGVTTDELEVPYVVRSRIVGREIG